MENISVNDINPQKKSDSTLIINLNEEYKIKIERGNQFSNSIFKDVYTAALHNIVEIVDQADKQNIYDDFNNIIAFTGERGKGKSSSMISFRDALLNQKLDEHKEFFKEFSKIQSKSFASIGIVDPSLFHGCESLFEIILAQMFEEFQKNIKKSDCILKDDDRRAIIKQFQEVYENLRILNSDRRDLYKKESIDALSWLATSSNLRHHFKELISIYLDKFEKNKNFLIIAIDDFDLNISGAYDMLEDIRQFFIQSRIVLLIACKIEQLNEVISVRFKKYNLTLDVDKKAEKFLEKLLPQHRRIILPDLLVIEKPTEILIDNYTYEGSNPNEAIAKSIYETTNLFINTPQYRNNTFIPDNFRGIINLLGLTNKQNPISELIKHVVKIAKTELDEDYYEIFNSLENQKSETLNISLANSISEIEKLKNILNSNNILFATNPLNVNVGDVYSLLYLIKNQLTYTNNKQIQFLDLLHIYYSLRLINAKCDGNIFSFYNSTSIKVFRKSSSNKYRDYIYFNKLNIKELLDLIDTENDKLWFLHFFVQFGRTNAKFRFESESPYFKSTAGVKNGLFSPLALFSNTLFTEKLAEQIGLNSFEELNLSKSIQEWNNGSNNLNKLFKNSMFYLELMQYFEEEAIKAHKTDGVDKTDDGKEIYFNTLFVYFTQSLEKALERISSKYEFLNINAISWINTHPIIKRWIEIEKDPDLKGKFSSVFQKIFDSQGENKYSEQDIITANSVLNTYRGYFYNDQSNNSNGAKRAMNHVIKSFKNKEINSELSKLRRAMDSNLVEGLKNIHDFLIDISNG
jgi:hypothetical protein